MKSYLAPVVAAVLRARDSRVEQVDARARPSTAGLRAARDLRTSDRRRRSNRLIVPCRHPRRPAFDVGATERRYVA